MSNVSPEQLAAAQSICEVVTVENRYNVGDRTSEAMVALCEQQGIVFFPWQPVAPEDEAVRRTLAVVAEAHGVSVQQVALAWLLAHSDMVVPIPGTTNIDHLDDNVDAAWLSLEDSETASLSSDMRDRPTRLEQCAFGDQFLELCLVVNLDTQFGRLIGLPQQ